MSEKTRDLTVKTQQTQFVETIVGKIKNFQAHDGLHLPENYSAQNSIRSAMLVIERTKNKANQPVLKACTPASIAEAILDMTIQGLSPVKGQCSFVAYGNRLTLQPTYQGKKAVCLRVDSSLQDVYAEVVYEGDDLEYSLVGGKREIVEHTQKLSNIDDSKIIAAYAVAMGEDGKVRRTELMTLDQIKQAWKMSPVKPVNEDGSLKETSAHAKFTSEMCKKTVTNRLAKHIIGASSDSDLIIQSIRRTEEIMAEAEADLEISEEANQGEVIDISPPDQEDEPESEPERSDEITEEEAAEIQAQEIAEAEDEKTEGGGPGF